MHVKLMHRGWDVRLPQDWLWISPEVLACGANGDCKCLMSSVSWCRSGKFSEGEKTHNSSRAKAYVPSLRNATDYYYICLLLSTAVFIYNKYTFCSRPKMDLGSRRERDCDLRPGKVQMARSTWPPKSGCTYWLFFSAIRSTIDHCMIKSSSILLQHAIAEHTYWTHGCTELEKVLEKCSDTKVGEKPLSCLFLESNLGCWIPVGLQLQQINQHLCHCTRDLKNQPRYSRGVSGQDCVFVLCLQAPPQNPVLLYLQLEAPQCT